MNKITLMLLQNPKTRGMIQSITMNIYKFKQDHRPLMEIAPDVISGVFQGLMGVSYIVKGAWMLLGMVAGALFVPTLGGAIIGAVIGLLMGWVIWLKTTPDEEEGPLGPTMGITFGLILAALQLHGNGKTFYTDFYEVLFLLLLWPLSFGFLGGLLPVVVKFIIDPMASDKK